MTTYDAQHGFGGFGGGLQGYREYIVKTVINASTMNAGQSKVTDVSYVENAAIAEKAGLDANFILKNWHWYSFT